ncbi:GNAT family N-acetyltransferase [Myceligenerans pegani]|uniref:GNAT family N-acetyltransferase n=1 Tax=Myceligenerans pegani TaxID=2776917 RepID=A0ABR9MU33_9MICO|nr:GNAT family protein [Myceligenerans sp. TRM 65318]MBE1874464.1 GNAT family N-acetyltransferase [Myceligenerans sp. TRM 65318]MBE3016735.1 GNAT family N-acetyltransferase [Myceligenerans sp. TRM 65318]
MSETTGLVVKGWTVSKPWPVTLREDTPGGVVVLRPLRRRDGKEWSRLRADNAAWLERWEATSPLTGENRMTAASFHEYVRTLSNQARSGTLLPFGMELDGELVGQLTVASITYGSLCSASIGYWVSEHVAGRGVTPTGVAMATDYCWFVLGLHRIEINIRPENKPSLRVVEKLGFRDEGVRERFLHIQGDWRDHRTFALTSEEVPGGLLARWQATREG